jgi:hypothetical protein
VIWAEDHLLAWLQRRCDHPGNMVAADILEGCVDSIQVKYCRRCGAVRTHWAPLPGGKPSPYSVLEWHWRLPDPHLWRDPVAWIARLRSRR